MAVLRDDELLLRLNNFEDSFVERKTASDQRDWIPATVAFANSAPIGFPCVLFIGARNDGTIEGKANLDSLQKTYTKLLQEVYPAVPTDSRIVVQNGLSCLAIIVLGSPERPHFPCHAFVRVKSETKLANDEIVRQLLDERNSKAYQLKQWIGTQITVDKLNVEHTLLRGNIGGSFQAKLTEANRFWLSIEAPHGVESFPLRRVELSYDPKLKQPKLEVAPF